jgi:hypothetical protein
MLQYECPLARAAWCREAGFMTGKTCLPCCCAWMPMRQPLTWRPGRWRARPARTAGWPRGGTAGSGRSGCAAGGPRGCGRGGRGAGPAAGPGSCCHLGARRAARTASRSSAPRRAWRWPGLATGPSPPLGVPAGTARGWLRRLRARAGQLRAHAIGELNGLGFYPPGPPWKPAGSPLGDALNALAAAVDCARRNFGYGPEMTWPLAGRLGLARFLMPAPAS